MGAFGHCAGFLFYRLFAGWSRDNEEPPLHQPGPRSRPLLNASGNPYARVAARYIHTGVAGYYCGQSVAAEVFDLTWHCHFYRMDIRAAAVQESSAPGMVVCFLYYHASSAVMRGCELARALFSADTSQHPHSLGYKNPRADQVRTGSPGRKGNPLDEVHGSDRPLCNFYPGGFVICFDTARNDL